MSTPILCTDNDKVSSFHRSYSGQAGGSFTTLT